jgi:probable HAF family extracellular repeat protein
MKTLLKIGLTAFALLASIGILAVRAGNNTPTFYAVTNLGPGGAHKASNPDGTGTFLVVGSTPPGPVATVWTVTTHGTVVDVFTYDTLLGWSMATDVNDHGMVIGIGFEGPFVDVPGVGLKHLPGGAANATGVNNQGVIAGSVFDASNNVIGAVWYVDATGGITGPVLTNTKAGVSFTPYDINDEGTMAGFVVTTSNGDTTAALARFDCNGDLEVQNLGVLHRADTAAFAASIDSDEVAVGDSGVSLGSEPNSGFLWTPARPNKLTSLGNLGGGGSFVLDINDDGQVVGQSVTEANVFVGFIWQSGKITDLNNLLKSPLNDTVELASGINNTGHIVGLLQSGNACVLTPQ